VKLRWCQLLICLDKLSSVVFERPQEPGKRVFLVEFEEKVCVAIQNGQFLVLLLVLCKD
jgi:hypothetical protein